MNETIGMVTFVCAFCLAIYFLKRLIEATMSPQFKADLERLREQRRRRKAARRNQ